MSAEAVARLHLVDVTLAPNLPGYRDIFVDGEIVGLAGLDGHGQEGFLETLAGLRPAAGGKVILSRKDGSKVAIASFRRAARHGVAYVPRDRKTNGIFPALSVLDNFAIASLGRDAPAGLIRSARRRARFDRWRERLSIVAASSRAPITALSGGNQQKVLVARWLARAPLLLLMNDPTRGVDQRTRESLYAVFRDLARGGMTLVILSSEIEEAVRLCDRVLVFREQRVAHVLTRPALTQSAVIAAMFGRAA